MSDLTPITREEALLDGADLEPITRKEQFIKRIYDKTQEVPEPITREEWFLNKAGEGGGGVTVEQLNATENGTYSEEGKAYSPVIVEVPQTTVESLNITANGTYTAPSGKAYSPVTVNVEGFKKKSIANTPTDIASFNDGTANPMPSLEISIEPVQSGSGDPSPSNVRPISSWSGANVTRCGKNLFNTDNVDSIVVSDTGAERNGVYVKGNGEFYISINAETTLSADYMYARVFNSDGTIKTTYNVISGTTIAPAGFSLSNGEHFALYDATGNVPLEMSIAKFERWEPQIEIGAQATTYEPYNGSTTSIPFHDSNDNPITVYGGTLNVTSGELTVTHGYVDLGTKDWSSSNYRFNTITALSDALPGNHANCICSMYKSDVGAATRIVDMSICLANNGYIYVYDTSFDGDANAFKQDKSGVQLVYELATPQTYQLTPAQVTTLLGQNNIFADCGQILEGEYFVTL